MAPIDSYVECLAHREQQLRRCVLAGVDTASVKEAWHSRDRL